MGPKLNLEFLTQDECERIIEVIQKDLVLQHVEQQRIWKINDEVRDINEFCKILGKQNSFNENYCLYCFLKFRLIFRRKYVCKLCEFNFCSNCVIFNDQQGGCECFFCVKKGQCQKQSLEWFYLRARSKFKRSGSSKVIRCLSLKNPFTGACKSQSLDGYSGLPQMIPDDDLSDLEMEKKIPFTSREKDLNELMGKLMDVQDSCTKESVKMRTHVAGLINIEKSLSEMDNALQSFGNNLLMDHHHHQDDSYHHHDYQQKQHLLSNSEDCCLCHCRNGTLLNLAANQISDITAVAAGVLERTLSRGAEIGQEVTNHINDGDDDDGDIASEVNSGNEEKDGYGDDTDAGDDDDSFDDDSIELDDEGSDSSTEKVDQSEDSSSDQSTVWARKDEAEELKSAEQEVYKVTSKTYMLGDRLMDLEEEIIVSNEDVFNRNVNHYEEKVAELAVEINTNQREVECLQKKVMTN